MVMHLCRFKDPDVERKKQRAQRFNLVGRDVQQAYSRDAYRAKRLRKMSRSRFPLEYFASARRCLPANVHSALCVFQIDADLEKDKMLKRAERFGTNHPELEQIKKEQRAARFGIVDEETKKKQRLDKFKPLPNAGKINFNMSVKQDDDFEAKRKVRGSRLRLSGVLAARQSGYGSEVKNLFAGHDVCCGYQQGKGFKKGRSSWRPTRVTGTLLPTLCWSAV
jgi:hypothetical protein